VLDQAGAPAVVFGFSMGGLIALDHQRAYPERHRATIAMAPPLGDPSVPRLLLHLARGLNRVAPHWIVRSPWLPRFSRFPSPELDSYRSDRLIECAITSRLAMALVDRSRQVRRLEHLKRPVLLIQGERDQICPPGATAEFAGRLGADLTTYPHARHHLLLESCRETVAADVCNWIASRA
jgi:alpha-beta hydrolase superfamily lysophospholipase